MLFNFGKCKCIHTGHGDEDAQHTMGNTKIIVKQKGLRIAAAKGNHIFLD